MTRDFPSEEKFGLVSQMRRATILVLANIAEGFKKSGQKDKINFYNIAQGSLNELKYYVILTQDLGYANELGKSRELINEVGKMLNGLVVSAQSRAYK